MEPRKPLPSPTRQAASNTSIAELQRLAGITLASMEAVRGNVEGIGRSDFLTRGVEGPMRSDLLTELRMTERAARFAAKVGDRVQNTIGDEGSVVALEPHHTGRGQTLVVKFDNGKEMKMSPGDVTFLRSEADPFEPPDEKAYSSYHFTFDSKADADKGFKILYDTLVGHASDPEEEDGQWVVTGVGTVENGSDAELLLKRAGIQFQSSETAMRDSEVKDYFAREGEPPEEARVSMRRLAHLQERAAARKSADPKWMTMATRIVDIYNEVADEIGLDSAPTGDAAIAVKVFFTYKVEKELGNSIPIEVYYELEDANYHTANKFLQDAGYFDAPYGERQDTWQAERKGLKPMWNR